MIKIARLSKSFIDGNHGDSVCVFNDFNLQIAPKELHYNHNDLHKRNVAKDEPQNGHSHILASLIGNSQTIPIVNGELQLGTWQSIFLIELDAARYRKINVMVIGQ